MLRSRLLRVQYPVFTVEEQKQNDDSQLAAAEAHQRDAEKRPGPVTIPTSPRLPCLQPEVVELFVYQGLHEAEQAANKLRSELQEACA